MPPKKKVKVEEKDKAEDGEDGKGEAGEGASGEGSTATHLAQQQVVGGPEAPKLDLGEGVEVVTYAPGVAMENLTAGKLLRVEVEAQHLTTENEAIKLRQCWGTDVYSENSDVVAIAMHTGVYTPTADVPKFAYLVVAIRVLPSHPATSSTTRNGLKSQSLAASEHTGLSLRVEGSAYCKTDADRKNLSKVLLRPARSDCVSVKGNIALSEARLIFNLSNEPAYKYSLAVVADRAPDAKMWTSVRLRQQTLYLETDAGARLEVSLVEESTSDNQPPPKYRLAELPNPRTTDKKAIQNLGVPLPASGIKVLQAGVKWSDFEWGVSGFSIGGTSHKVRCCYWLPVTSKETAAQ